MNQTSLPNLDRTAIAQQVKRRVNDHQWVEHVIDRGLAAAAAMKQADTETIRRQTNRLRGWVCQAAPGAAAEMPSEEALSLAIGIVQSAVSRTLGIELFNVQWRAGIVISLGGIAEMQTGEGKTLAGVLPALLLSMHGEGVHVATPNGYLARRDYESCQPIFSLCGLTTGLVDDSLDGDQARRAYWCDITYGSAHTFGFDYLRDQRLLQQSNEQPIGQQFLSKLRGHQTPGQEQRPRGRGLAVAIVDEADDVLLDDAVSPLILSAAPSGEAVDAELYRLARQFGTSLRRDVDFRLLDEDRVELTQLGFETTYRQTEAAFHDRLLRPWHEYVESSLRAAHCFHRDVHYVVREGDIQLIDRSTGRVFADRTWSGGLHQSVQASEGLPIRSETQTLGQITKQRFFRSYRLLAGMTGTADQCHREFASVYAAPVSVIEPRLPSKRETYPPRISPTHAEKLAAVTEEAIQIAAAQRPVLIGTLSVSESLQIAERLRERGQSIEVLNGVQDADEAQIIAAAGRAGAITVATNLAGRGTDIQLDDEARANGGLHVIVTQMHSVSRVDRQLIGRAARCGDPGSYRIFVAADDAVLAAELPWLTRHIQRQQEFSSAQAEAIVRQINRVQHRCQRAASSLRMRLLRSDASTQELLQPSVKRPDTCWAM